MDGQIKTPQRLNAPAFSLGLTNVAQKVKILSCWRRCSKCGFIVGFGSFSNWHNCRNYAILAVFVAFSGSQILPFVVLRQLQLTQNQAVSVHLRPFWVTKSPLLVNFRLNIFQKVNLWLKNQLHQLKKAASVVLVF